MESTEEERAAKLAKETEAFLKEHEGHKGYEFFTAYTGDAEARRNGRWYCATCKVRQAA